MVICCWWWLVAVGWMWLEFVGVENFCYLCRVNDILDDFLRWLVGWTVGRKK